jgi:hypothetical protein
MQLHRDIALGHGSPLLQLDAQAVCPQHRAAQPHLHISFRLENLRPLVEGLAVGAQP